VSGSLKILTNILVPSTNISNTTSQSHVVTADLRILETRLETCGSKGGQNKQEWKHSKQRPDLVLVSKTGLGWCSEFSIGMHKCQNLIKRPQKVMKFGRGFYNNRKNTSTTSTTELNQSKMKNQPRLVSAVSGRIF